VKYWWPNNQSVYQCWDRVADILRTAMKDRILYGPLKLEELPWNLFKRLPKTVRLKQNGPEPGSGKLTGRWHKAYKHVSVRCEDHHLQVVEFGPVLY
jgi:hypothetical protein